MVDGTNSEDRKDRIRYINLQLAALGQPQFQDDADKKEKLANERFNELTSGLVSNLRQKRRQLGHALSPVDSRIQNFIDSYLSDVKIDKPYRLPNDTFILGEKGIAREVSLPPNGNSFKNNLLSSYRVKQGILNNPDKDKRTTKGTFHIVDGGLPVPPDKKEVPKIAFAHLLHHAMYPDKELKILPFTANQEDKARVMVSLMLRPVVCPEVPGVIDEKSMEVRFFAPGSLVSNLDFVENIFGNAGDHTLPKNDAGLDVNHWSGHTGCIILAPQLIHLKKKDIGLPQYDKATERQRQDGMCWKDENELYNEGGAFKVTCRDDRGIVVTLIADNYYGYSKKEIKTQISYAANLYGLVEEEHAGGAIAFARKNFSLNVSGAALAEGLEEHFSFEEAIRLLGDRVEVKDEGYAVDKTYPEIIYVPENANLDIPTGRVNWEYGGTRHKLKLSPKSTYIYPSGYKFNLLRHPTQSLWRLIRTEPEGVFCHKPSTVSGGGKSEISKSLLNAIKFGNFFINDMEEDFAFADKLINYDYSNRWAKGAEKDDKRPFLSNERTIGSVIKLMTASSEYSEKYNKFVSEIPDHIRMLVLLIKRYYKTDSDLDWKEHFTVEMVNGKNGHALMFDHQPVIASYVRVGFNTDNIWYMHKLRSDFLPSRKIQMEDDISASITLPRSNFKNLDPTYGNPSLKVVQNCEAFQFQRPDEAVIRGYDKKAESDLISDGTFLTNYEPLPYETAVELYEDAVIFDQYTQPVKDFISGIVEEGKNDIYFVTPSHTRLVDGIPTNNPRYLEKNDFKEPNFESYLGDIGVRLHRKIATSDPVIHPVNAVLPGRRNNPIDQEAGIRPLSVYNPIHYQELPELFMDFICSLTGKSPSTTGAGSEGALTKGPFNMLVPTTDLNNALLSYILTEYPGFSSAAGYIGHENRFDHDISILIPEIWAKLEPHNRDPEYLIETGSLEKLDDFEYEGKNVYASRLGYRITRKFLFSCLNRLFDLPSEVFNEEMLKPELQGMEAFVDGINNIVEAQQKVANLYFTDNSVEAAIPPLKILLHIMAFGHFEGRQISDPELRKYFDRDYVMNSDWYQERLQLKQRKEITLRKTQLKNLQDFAGDEDQADLFDALHIDERIEECKKALSHAESEEYLESLRGTIGADPLFRGS